MQRFTNPIQTIAAWLLFAVVIAAAGGHVFAGDGFLAQTTGPVTNVVSGRSFTVEIGIVVVMFGGALFAICRSSNRT